MKSIFLIVAAFLLAAGAYGCASYLQDNVQACMSLDRTTSYTVNGKSESFRCEAKS